MTEINDLAFGKNDLRGIFGKEITTKLFYYVARAYIRYIQIKSENNDATSIWVSVARDARHHSPELTKALIKGLTSTGANVINLGLAPSPIGYFSEFAKLDFGLKKEIKISGTLVVTASHNPSEYNGLKMTYNKTSLGEEAINEIKELTKKEERTRVTTGHSFGITRSAHIIPQYIEFMLKSFVKIGQGLKVVVDSANATAGVVAPQLYKELGCEVVELYSEPDGDFPNHHPNPSDEKTLDDIKAKVLETKADFGLAFDGDSDRLGIVDDKGNFIAGDKLLLIFALDILNDFKNRNEKPTFISEVKCSQSLFDTINENGGNAIMWKTGHGFIKAKMKEENAIFAGEMSGHIFFKDRFYGYDDAVYAGCRFIEIMAKKRQQNPSFKASDFMEILPNTLSSKEVRYKCPNELKQPVLKELENIFDNNKNIFASETKNIIKLDGLRLVFDDGFALIRQSNTEPVFTIRFEAGTKENLKNYQKTMLDLVDKSLENQKAAI